MNSGNIEENKPGEDTFTVHHVLAHSYLFYFGLFLFGTILDFFIPISLFNNPVFRPIGFIVLILASLLIIWAQRTSIALRKIEKINKEAFCRGPYCYTRSPTHWGLFLLLLGFSIIADAGFVATFTIVAFLVTKFVFLRKEEAILAAKYGTPYLEYKKFVKF
jgi:protein-S-isoprenylcysteine O-methyltransferase Ste14